MSSDLIRELQLELIRRLERSRDARAITGIARANSSTLRLNMVFRFVMHNSSSRANGAL